MAHGARTLQYVDDTPRPLFGLSLVEACAVLITFYLAHQAVPPTLLRGTAALLPPALLWGACLLTHRVRWEPYADQLYGFVVRCVLGWPRRPPRSYAVLEVDGFTRDALTEEQQDLRLIARLQGILAGLDTGAAIQLLVTNDSRSTAAIVRQVRARQKPVSWGLMRLGKRRCERLSRALVRSSDLHFYIAIYAAAPAALSLDRLVSWRGEAATAVLDDLVEQVRTTLGHMGLATHLLWAGEGIAAKGGDVVPGGEHLQHVDLVDGQRAASLYMLLPPGRTDPGWLDPLVTMPGTYRLAVWIHGLDTDREITRLEARQRRNDVEAFMGLMKRASGMRATTRAALDETDEAILRLRQPGQGLVRCGVYVTVVAPTGEEAHRRLRRAALLLKGAAAARPATGLGDQWLLYQSTRPGGDVAQRCWRMDAETAANAYPFNRANPSTRGGFEIGTTARGELVRLDPTDPSLRNALMVIFGLSGMGKTFFVLKCLAEWLLMGHRLTVLDRSGHYATLCALAGGVTVTTAAELAAVPAATRMVVVDLSAYTRMPDELRAAVDRRVQTPYEGPTGYTDYTGPAPLHAFVLEEAWQFEFMDAALWMNDLARRGRHWGGFVLYVTHEPADLLNNPILTSMFSAAAIKVAFALDDKEGVASKLGAAMGLTPREIDTVKSLRIGECYLMRHNKLQGAVVRGTVQVTADEDEKWLFVNDPRLWQYQRRAQEIERQGGDVARAVFSLADAVPFDDEPEEATV